jgi:hypothetical protein
MPNLNRKHTAWQPIVRPSTAPASLLRERRENGITVPPAFPTGIVLQAWNLGSKLGQCLPFGSAGS